VVNLINPRSLKFIKSKLLNKDDSKISIDSSIKIFALTNSWKCCKCRVENYNNKWVCSNCRHERCNSCKELMG
jgi:hypothetical protein